MPYKDHVVLTQGGRKLHVREAGQADGVPVLVHHGSPGAGHLFRPWIEDAQSRGLRLLCYDRPGYGDSTAHPGRSVADVAEDVAAIARHLDLDRLCTWGESGGGPHVLACAALLPDLVVAAAVIASPTPFKADGVDWFEGMGDDNLEEFGAALDGRGALEKYIEAHTPGILNADAKGLLEAFRSLLSPADAAVLTEEYAEFKLKQIQAGIKGSRDGWIDDDLAFIIPWGFDLGKIKVPVLLLHGQQDRFVPFSHGEWLANKISGVETRLTEEDGHLTLTATGIPKVHEWLLSKMK